MRVWDTLVMISFSCPSFIKYRVLSTFFGLADDIPRVEGNSFKSRSC